MKRHLRLFIVSCFLISGINPVVAQIQPELNYRKTEGIMTVVMENQGTVLMNGVTTGLQLKNIRVHIFMGKKQKSNSGKRDNSELFDAAMQNKTGNLSNQPGRSNSMTSRIKESPDSFNPFVDESFLHALFASWISVHFNAEIPIIMLPKR